MIDKQKLKSSKNGKIISEGFTQEHGKNHAEINAIKKVNDREILKKSTLYVTLEPCSHYGKTPPCCEAIYNKQIRKVVIGINDPNKLVNGRAVSYTHLTLPTSDLV